MVEHHTIVDVFTSSIIDLLGVEFLTLLKMKKGQQRYFLVQSMLSFISIFWYHRVS